MGLVMKNFDISEFDCTHTGRNEMEKGFLERLDILRDRCGFPFVITSGFRDVTHPKEAHKPVGGYHTQGVAADIKVTGGVQRRMVVEQALQMGFSGIGVAKDFVHVDDRRAIDPQAALVMWCY